MGSTNFLPFNPSQAQQETDAEYAGDATRTGGALDGNAWPDVSANKTLYQAAGGVYAIMLMMANRGYVVNDTNLLTLAATLAAILTQADLANLTVGELTVTLNALIDGTLTVDGLLTARSLVCPTRTPGDDSTNAATTAFVQAALAASFSSGSNGNGSWVVDPTGTITQRGVISVSASGTLATGSIVFPINFSTTANLGLIVSVGNSGNGSGEDCMTCYYKNLSVAGALAVVRGAVNIGGSGISGLSTPVPVTWIAIGN